MIRYLCAIVLLTIANKISFAQQYGTLKDSRDGRVYKTVKIGEQEWMAENLNVDRFSNGDLIPEAKTNDEWARFAKEGKPAWCYYENNPENGIPLGKLYNWYAVKDPRGLAPIGYRIPNLEDWTTLSYYAGNNDPGWKLKSTESWLKSGYGWKDTPGWDKCLGCWDWSTKRRERAVCKICNNTKQIWKDPVRVGYGSNELGFSALPGGARYTDEGFRSLNLTSAWWCSSYFSNEINMFTRYGLSAYNDEFRRIDHDGFATGLSVRCIKGSDSRTLISNADAESPINKISNNNFPNSGIVQPNNKESNTSIAKNNNNSVNNSPLFNCSDLAQKIKYKIDNTRLNLTGDGNKDVDFFIETIIKPVASEYITSIISNANRVVSKEERDAIATQTISCIKNIDFKFNNSNTQSNRNNNKTGNADPLSNLISDYLFNQTFRSPSNPTNNQKGTSSSKQEKKLTYKCLCCGKLFEYKQPGYGDLPEREYCSKKCKEYAKKSWCPPN